MLKRTTCSQKTESLRRPKNIDVRSREYLRPDEVKRLISAAKSIGRHKTQKYAAHPDDVSSWAESK
jgi:hypothetical protein